MVPSLLLSSVLTALMLAALFWPLERLFPARKQPLWRADIGTDFLFLFGQHLVWSLLAIALLRQLDVALQAAVSAQLQEAFAGLPKGIQLIAVVLIGDFGLYWFHRACHHFDFLWRFHAVHHSSERLDWVAAHREHPIDGLLTQITLNLPAMVLGFSVEALTMIAIFRGLWATYIHSNIKLPIGPLRYVLGAPELHHWHHAKHARVTKNFGNLSPWTDLLFGTFHLPQAHEDWALGVPEELPRSWHGLLLSPFTRAWRDSSGWRTMVVGPVVLLGLATLTLGGMQALANTPNIGAVDAGSTRDSQVANVAPLGEPGRYLAASKSFGPPLPASSFDGLGRRGDPTAAAGEPPLDHQTVESIVSAGVTGCSVDAGALSGRLAVSFIVQKDGSVSDLETHEDNLPRGTSSCWLKRIGRLRFPVKKQAFFVSYSFTFGLG